LELRGLKPSFNAALRVSPEAKELEGVATRAMFAPELGALVSCGIAKPLSADRPSAAKTNVFIYKRKAGLPQCSNMRIAQSTIGFHRAKKMQDTKAQTYLIRRGAFGRGGARTGFRPHLLQMRYGIPGKGLPRRLNRADISVKLGHAPLANSPS